MYLRHLKSGKWQATVRLLDGHRVTYTAALKGEARDWAADQEQRIRTGTWRDPRTTRVLLRQWWGRWYAARVVEDHTRRNERTAVKRVLDAFGGRSIGSIGRVEVQAWVHAMQAEDTGRHAIRQAYNLLRACMTAAVDEGIIDVSPCRRITLPPTDPKAPEWFTQEQVDDIVAALREGIPDKGHGHKGNLTYPRHAAAVELMVWTGLRWGEMAGLRIGDVDWLRRRIRVVGARTQAGRWKDYPKSSRSRREVPVPERVINMLAPLAGDRGDGEALFLSKRSSRPWSAGNWWRIWTDAVARAKAPAYSPHSCRHTCASWLVQAGVPLYDVQRLLGHESFATTQRYAHLAPDAHEPIEEAWVRIVTHQRRTASKTDADPVRARARGGHPTRSR